MVFNSSKLAFSHKVLMVSLLSSTLLLSQANADTVIKIDTNNPGASINKNVYGQFMEHLGRGIYEGIWVGKDSSIDNVNGFRSDVVSALQDLHVPLVRWPGGCFADEYHWRDGIGPQDKRPVTINSNWGGVTDDNAFGTHEFFEFAELIDAEVYVNANVGTGTPQEMAQWLEYMTSETQSTLANLRRENGREEPWKVDYFAIGNEAWGCGGSMTPEYYTNVYKRYATFVKTPDDNQPVLIASGGNDDTTEWAEHLIQNVEDSWTLRMQAISHHYYTIPSTDWDNKGSALGFQEGEWFSTLKNTLKIDGYVKDNVAVLDEHDPEGRVAFYVDEWGTWYDPEGDDDPGFLYQQNSMRDAIVASLNFNIFHQYARRVHMTNIAQMVNVLQAMILTDKEKMILTPTYHLLRMYVPFQDATFIPLAIMGEEKYTYGSESIEKISATAAVAKDGKLYLALTNTDPNDAELITIDGYLNASGQILSSELMDAHNSFENPNNVEPEEISVSSRAGVLSFELPAKSIVVLALQ